MLEQTNQEWYNSKIEKFGKEKVIADEKMIKNRNADQKQYNKYKDLLGKDAPISLAKFQDLKYNNISEYEKLNVQFKDEKLRNKIKSNDFIKVIDGGKQGKHIIGHNNYISGRSYLTIPILEVQELVNTYAGTGKLLRDTKGKWQNQEVVSTQNIIGLDIDDITGKKVETTDFKIHYGKNGVHIVPKRRFE